MGAGRKHPGAGTQTLVSLNFSAVVAPLEASVKMVPVLANCQFFLYPCPFRPFWLPQSKNLLVYKSSYVVCGSHQKLSFILS